LVRNEKTMAPILRKDSSRGANFVMGSVDANFLTGSVDTGCDFDGGDFAVVEPDQGALEARIDYDVAGSVIGVDVHPGVTDGAGDSSLQFFDIEWRGGSVNSRFVRSAIPNCIAKILVANEHPAAALTECDGVFVE
jgi:hypothetical protein